MLEKNEIVQDLGDKFTVPKKVDRKWGFWDIDLGKFQKLGQFFSPEFSRKIKNKNLKKYKI